MATLLMCTLEDIVNKFITDAPHIYGLYGTSYTITGGKVHPTYLLVKSSASLKVNMVKPDGTQKTYAFSGLVGLFPKLQIRDVVDKSGLTNYENYTDPNNPGNCLVCLDDISIVYDSKVVTIKFQNITLSSSALSSGVILTGDSGLNIYTFNSTDSTNNVLFYDSVYMHGVNTLSMTVNSAHIQDAANIETFSVKCVFIDSNTLRRKTVIEKFTGLPFTFKLSDHNSSVIDNVNITIRGTKKASKRVNVLTNGNIAVVGESGLTIVSTTATNGSISVDATTTSIMMTVSYDNTKFQNFTYKFIQDSADVTSQYCSVGSPYINNDTIYRNFTLSNIADANVSTLRLTVDKIFKTVALTVRVLKNLSVAINGTAYIYCDYSAGDNYEILPSPNDYTYSVPGVSSFVVTVEHLPDPTVAHSGKVYKNLKIIENTSSISYVSLPSDSSGSYTQTFNKNTDFTVEFDLTEGQQIPIWLRYKPSDMWSDCPINTIEDMLDPNQQLIWDGVYNAVVESANQGKYHIKFTRGAGETTIVHWDLVLTDTNDNIIQTVDSGEKTWSTAGETLYVPSESNYGTITAASMGQQYRLDVSLRYQWVNKNFEMKFTMPSGMTTMNSITITGSINGSSDNMPVASTPGISSGVYTRNFTVKESGDMTVTFKIVVSATNYYYILNGLEFRYSFENNTSWTDYESAAPVTSGSYCTISMKVVKPNTFNYDKITNIYFECRANTVKLYNLEVLPDQATDKVASIYNKSITTGTNTLVISPESTESAIVTTTPQHQHRLKLYIANEVTDTNLKRKYQSFDFKYENATSATTYNTLVNNQNYTFPKTIDTNDITGTKLNTDYPDRVTVTSKVTSFYVCFTTDMTNPGSVTADGAIIVDATHGTALSGTSYKHASIYTTAATWDKLNITYAIPSSLTSLYNTIHIELYTMPSYSAIGNPSLCVKLADGVYKKNTLNDNWTVGTAFIDTGDPDDSTSSNATEIQNHFNDKQYWVNMILEAHGMNEYEILGFGDLLTVPSVIDNEIPCMNNNIFFMYLKWKVNGTTTYPSSVSISNGIPPYPDSTLWNKYKSIYGEYLLWYPEGDMTTMITRHSALDSILGDYVYLCFRWTSNIYDYTIGTCHPEDKWTPDYFGVSPIGGLTFPNVFTVTAADGTTLIADGVNWPAPKLKKVYYIWPSSTDITMNVNNGSGTSYARVMYFDDEKVCQNMTVDSFVSSDDYHLIIDSVTYQSGEFEPILGTRPSDNQMVYGVVPGIVVLYEHWKVKLVGQMLSGIVSHTYSVNTVPALTRNLPFQTIYVTTNATPVVTEETRYMNIQYSGTIAINGGSGIILATCGMDDLPTGPGNIYFEHPNDILDDWNHISVKITRSSDGEFSMTSHYWKIGGTGTLTLTRDVQAGERLWVYQILRNAVEHATVYTWHRLGAIGSTNKFGSLTSWYEWTTAEPQYSNIV